MDKPDFSKYYRYREITEASQRLDQDVSRDSNINVIAEEVGMPAAELWEIVQKGLPARSLDEGAGEEGDTRSRLEKLIEENSRSPDWDVIEGEMRGCVDELLDHLKERERFIS